MPNRLPLYLVGDPHGSFRDINSQLCRLPPGVVVTLGDHDLVVPYRVAMAPAISAGHQCYFIPGNHDLEFGYDLLWADYGARNISGHVAELGGWRVAGLGGIFMGRVWYPRTEEDQPKFRNRQEMLRSKGTLGEFGKNTVEQIIFPDDVDRLSRQRADILVTHESAPPHKHGFQALGKLAADMRVTYHAHGDLKCVLYV
jgi:hypothetical protein